MPRGDGTGPPAWGRRGRGRGAGRRSGRGRRWRAGQAKGGGVAGRTREPFIPAQAREAAEAQELARLKEQGAAVEQQLEALRERTAAVQTGRSGAVASIDEERCTLCGLCETICPTRAITLGQRPRVDVERCSGCGVCVEQCPNAAITLTG